MKHMKIRELRRDDINHGFAEVFNVINHTKVTSSLIYNMIRKRNTHTFVLVHDNGDILATATVILCYKGGGCLALIEDVAVHPLMQGLGFGSDLIQHILKEAEEDGCYKVILLCLDNNVKFYKKNGMDLYQNCMCKKLPAYYKNKEEK